MLSSIVRLLRLVSLVICAIVIASFAIFAFNQTETASKQQTEEVTNGPAARRNSDAATAHESSVHKDIDDAAREFTSPFAGIVSSNSEWLTRGVKLFFALLVYGVGVGFLARALRI